MEPTINTIMVPQGAEYQAICRGLQHQTGQVLQICPLPVGPTAVTQYLHQWVHNVSQQADSPQVLVMGLCGSLRSQHGVGDIVSYTSCYDGCSPSDQPSLTCDPPLTTQVHQMLSSTITPVSAVTCDRVINTVREKHQLGATYTADVVDMEGFAILSCLQSLHIPVAMVRVVSDDAMQDLPDLTTAFTPEGNLKPLPLALGMVQRPRAAIRLIRGSLRGLKILEDLTRQLLSYQTL